MTPEKGCGRFQAVVTIPFGPGRPVEPPSGSPLVRSIPLRRVSEPGNEPVALENAPSGDTVPVHLSLHWKWINNSGERSLTIFNRMSLINTYYIL